MVEDVFKKFEEHISEVKVEITEGKVVKGKQIYQYKSEVLASLLIDKQIQENLKKSF